jgi:hypothetical protein
VKINGITLRCFDFAPHELQTPIHEVFMSKLASYVVVFNLAQPDLNAIDYWLNKIRLFSPDAAVYVVGTKSNIAQSTEIDRKVIAVIESHMRQRLHVVATIAVDAITKHNMP